MFFFMFELETVLVYQSNNPGFKMKVFILMIVLDNRKLYVKSVLTLNKN